MTSSMVTSMTKCELGDWIGIAVLSGVGLFSLTFLAMGAAVLARYLFERDRNRRTGTT